MHSAQVYANTGPPLIKYKVYMMFSVTDSNGPNKPTLNVKPNIILSFLVNLLGNYRWTVLQIVVTHQVIFIQISTIHDNISSQVANKRR